MLLSSMNVLIMAFLVPETIWLGIFYFLFFVWGQVGKSYHPVQRYGQSIIL
jgi:hypothetical protein